MAGWLTSAHIYSSQAHGTVGMAGRPGEDSGIRKGLTFHKNYI
jgi:hypothetical protein